MALVDQLPEDLNPLICRSICALDFDFEELGRLRRVSKLWRQAVESGSLGRAGPFHQAGLRKFACRVVDSKQISYPALGILNKSGTVLHVHPLRQGRMARA